MSGASREEHGRGVLAVVLAALLWSSGGLVIKWVEADAVTVTLWRSLLAALTMALLVRPDPSSLSRMPGAALALAVSYAAMLFCFVSATKLTLAANAIFLQYTAPVHVVWMEALLYRRRPTRLDLMTLVLAFLGMVLFFAGRMEAGHGAGNLLAVLSGLGFALFLALLRHPRADRDLRSSAMVAGNLLLFLALLVVQLATGRFQPLSPADMSGITFLGVIQIGVAYVIFEYGISRVPALEASLIAMLEPVLNPVWVFLLLGERPGPWAAIGGGVILGAVLLRVLLAGRR